MANCIVFWQRMLTPHMTELARELARAGTEVHYATEHSLSPERHAMGWRVEDFVEFVIHFIHDAAEVCTLVDRLPAHAVHITQGVRSNGLIAHAQKRIMLKCLRHYPIMEKVDLRGPAGWIKPLVYALRFRRLVGGTEGLLAIGAGTSEWIEKRSPENLQAIPFAYFLAGRRGPLSTRKGCRTKFIFVGNLVGRKRVDLLLEALSALRDRPFDVEIVGDGPDRQELERKANELLPDRTRFSGSVDMADAIDRIAHADCLVLPSAHDGWGAVISEALINGTPVICSSACGASAVVAASGLGAVFQAECVDDLRRSLTAILDKGPVSALDRGRLSAWASCLTAESGARYLLKIVGGAQQLPVRIAPPWEQRPA